MKVHLPGERRNSDVLLLQLLGRPVVGPYGGFPSRLDVVVFLGERHHRALSFVAAEHRLAPVQEQWRDGRTALDV